MLIRTYTTRSSLRCSDAGSSCCPGDGGTSRRRIQTQTSKRRSVPRRNRSVRCNFLPSLTDTPNERRTVMTRIGILGVFHETNSFSGSVTGLDKFQPRWYLRDEIITTFSGSRTVIGGAIDEGRQRELELVPMFATYATPSGPITPVAFEAILAAIESSLVSDL